MLVLILVSINTFSQQMAFNVVYVEAEENSENEIGELFDLYRQFYKGISISKRCWLISNDYYYFVRCVS